MPDLAQNKVQTLNEERLEMIIYNIVVVPQNLSKEQIIDVLKAIEGIKKRLHRHLDRLA